MCARNCPTTGDDDGDDRGSARMHQNRRLNIRIVCEILNIYLLQHVMHSCQLMSRSVCVCVCMFVCVCRSVGVDDRPRDGHRCNGSEVPKSTAITSSIHQYTMVVYIYEDKAQFWRPRRAATRIDGTHLCTLACCRFQGNNCHQCTLDNQTCRK